MLVVAAAAAEAAAATIASNALSAVSAQKRLAKDNVEKGPKQFVNELYYYSRNLPNTLKSNGLKRTFTFITSLVAYRLETRIYQ